MAERPSLATEWASYEAACIPATADDTQRIESRRAFYAGARSLFTLLILGVSTATEETPGDVALMATVEDELAAFNEAVKAGRA